MYPPARPRAAAGARATAHARLRRSPKRRALSAASVAALAAPRAIATRCGLAHVGAHSFAAPAVAAEAARTHKLDQFRSQRYATRSRAALHTLSRARIHLCDYTGAFSVPQLAAVRH